MCSAAIGTISIWDSIAAIVASSFDGDFDRIPGIHRIEPT